MARKTFTLEDNKIIMTYYPTDVDDMIVKEFPLHRISAKTLHEIRLLYCIHELKCTYAIIKDESGIRVAKIPQNYKFHGISGYGHICGNCSRSCAECLKIFDRFAESADKDEYGVIYYQDIKRLKKYPYIKRGVEAFNAEMGSQFMLIEACSLYVPFEACEQKKLSPMEKDEKLRSLYRYFVVDIHATEDPYLGTRHAYNP